MAGQLGFHPAPPGPCRLQLVATMLYLDSENKKDMNLYINCSGGEVVPSLAIHDTMRHIKSDVGTVGFGGCMGMSGFLLAVGKKVRVRRCGAGWVCGCGWHIPHMCVSVGVWHISALRQGLQVVSMLWLEARQAGFTCWPASRAGVHCQACPSSPASLRRQRARGAIANQLSNACAPLLVPPQGKRFALQNTRIMVHHPSGAARGQASDINREARELLRIRDYMDNILAQATGQPFEKVGTRAGGGAGGGAGDGGGSGGGGTFTGRGWQPGSWCWLVWGGRCPPHRTRAVQRSQSSAIQSGHPAGRIAGKLGAGCCPSTANKSWLCAAALPSPPVTHRWLGTSAATSTLTPRRRRSTASLTRQAGCCASGGGRGCLCRGAGGAVG